jgi:hypothetical protein
MPEVLKVMMSHTRHKPNLYGMGCQMVHPPDDEAAQYAELC